MTDLTNPNENAPLAGEANQITQEIVTTNYILKEDEKIDKTQATVKKFGQLAPVLIKMGYDPLPIVPGTKRPRPSNWTGYSFTENSKDFARDYTGILTKRCPSIDIDISDEKLVQQIVEIVYEVTGCHDTQPLSRTGMFPRKLLLFRTDKPYPKITSGSYDLTTDPIIEGKKKFSKVEILADGQQFVSFAIHPDTNKPYTWTPKGDPTSVYRSDLWELPRDNALEIIRQCDLLLGKHGTKVGKSNVTGIASDTPRMSNKELVARDPEICISALASIPNDGVDFDQWIAMLYAAKAALGDEGREPFLSWSRKSEFKHDENKTKLEWLKARPTKCGAGLIYHIAQEHGWQHPERTSSINDFYFIADEPGDITRLSAFRREENGALKPSKENLVIALRSPEICGYKLRNDVFRGEVMLALPSTDGWRAFKDTDYTDLCIRLERGSRGFKDIAKDRIRDAVAYAADVSEFDSAQHWLNSLEWDGNGRVATFLATYFGAQDIPYTSAIGCYLWSALAGRVMQPGIKADMVPVAVGAQGLGKSSTIKAIAPAPEHFLELDLGGKEDDMARMMLGKLVVELGELKGLRTREVEHVKSFITRTHEEWVPKFREMKTSYPRRCIFFGSTNKSEFLQDESGHRRWLPFDVGVCAPELLRADKDQLWAEALVMFNTGGIRWREAEQLAGAEHDKYVQRDAWEEPVAQWLQTPDQQTSLLNSDTTFSAVDVLTKALKLDTKFITQHLKDRMARVLKELGYRADRATVNGQRKRVYVKKD